MLEGGAAGRFVSCDAPIGYPPVFFLPDSVAGQELRAFVVARGWDAEYHQEPTDSLDSAMTDDSNNYYSTNNDNYYNINNYDNIDTPLKTGSPQPPVHLEKSPKNPLGSAGGVGVSAFVASAATVAGSSSATASAASGVAVGSGDYTVGAVIGDILDYKERDWLEWLGVTNTIPTQPYPILPYPNLIVPLPNLILPEP